MIQGANPVTARYARPSEHTRARRAGRGQIIGSTLLAFIYGVVLYTSSGLFQTPPTDARTLAYRVIGLVNVIVLPLLVVAAIIGVRRLRLGGASHQRISRLLMTPLWVSFTLSLLTVPIWMGQANAAQHDLHAASVGSVATFLLAPWGFMLAYGVSLCLVCAMYDCTFPYGVGSAGALI
ncbi:MAG: hypothetical protein LC793_07020 [Thermomicrobia bacterium]|nr:hypothetical protein [Thermomicrobia bacterium]MCA1723566.1 hypothetical protein [Thermomicrobia bacterium]